MSERKTLPYLLLLCWTGLDLPEVQIFHWGKCYRNPPSYQLQGKDVVKLKKLMQMKRFSAVRVMEDCYLQLCWILDF